jgi:hypothetical protein
MPVIPLGGIRWISVLLIAQCCQCLGVNGEDSKKTGEKCTDKRRFEVS